MKSFLLIALSFILVQNLAAQKEATTFTDIEKAKAYAVENNQSILMIFAGSDWCKPCIQFKKDVLESTTFSDKLGEQLSILYLDFPARKKNRLSKEQTAHNEALAERFNKSGAFPKIVLLDTNEQVLASPEFKGQTALDFVQELQPSLVENREKKD